MQAHSALIVLDETLAGDELHRVTQFLDDIAAICPIKSVSGLIRHVEQHTPLAGVPMLAGDPSLASQTGVPVLSMRYSAWHPDADEFASGVLNHDQLQQQLSELLWRCVNDPATHTTNPKSGMVLGNLSQTVAHYDVVVCVRPTCGTGAQLTRGDQLVCQLADTGQRPLWRCPREYIGIHRVVVAWPDAEAGQTLLESGIHVATAWNIPFCVLWAGSKRHQSGIENSIRSACRERGVTPCEILHGERLEDVAKSVNADDLLVMGAYGRWWPWRLLTNSHTESILQDLPCPALLLPRRKDLSTSEATTDSQLWSTARQPKREAANACATR